MSCKRFGEFLEDNNIEVTERQSAAKEPIEAKGARALLKAASEVTVARGQKLRQFSSAEVAQEMDEVLALVMGRSGKLRAPTAHVGTKVFVGFNSSLCEALAKTLKS